MKHKAVYNASTFEAALASSPPDLEAFANDKATAADLPSESALA